MKIPCTKEDGRQGIARLSLIEVPIQVVLEKLVQGEEKELNLEEEVEVPISPYVEAEGFLLA